MATLARLGEPTNPRLTRGSAAPRSTEQRVLRPVGLAFGGALWGAQAIPCVSSSSCPAAARPLDQSACPHLGTLWLRTSHLRCPIRRSRDWDLPERGTAARRGRPRDLPMCAPVAGRTLVRVVCCPVAFRYGRRECEEQGMTSARKALLGLLILLSPPHGGSPRNQGGCRGATAGPGWRSCRWRATPTADVMGGRVRTRAC